MIFLGAGASKPFGIKTLQEMTFELKGFLAEQGYSDVVDEISKSLSRFGLEADFEGIYTIVQAMTNPQKSIYSSGPLTAYLCKDSLVSIPPEKCEDLLRKFKEFLYRACQPNPSMVPKIKETYTRFFDILKEYHSPQDEEYTYSIRIPDEKPTETIVTTNYDMILDQYFWNEGVELIDGFRKTTERPQISALDLAELWQNLTLSRKSILIKLHGSIWTFKDGSSIFKTSADPKSCPIQVNIEENMMIFPVNDKPVLKFPYYDFYDFFRKRPWKKLVVVGYSFRDAPVNFVIQEHLKRVKDSRIVLIDPNPEKAIRNFIDSISEDYSRRIIPIKGEFGKAQTFDLLQQALDTFCTKYPTKRV